jgi:hypothetical protein
MHVDHGKGHMQNIETEKTTRTLERFLAVVATAACLAGAIRVWQVTYVSVPGSIAATSNLLPGLYVLEMLILSGLGISSVFRNWVKALWAVAGAILAFSVMGAWSIGLAFLPTAVLFTLAAILATRRQRQNLMADVAVWIGAGIAQVGVMLIVIRIVDSTAVF